MPEPGDLFTCLTADGGLTGDFTAVLFPEQAGLDFDPLRDANSLALAVSPAPAPLPGALWLLAPALLGLARRRRASAEMVSGSR